MYYGKIKAGEILFAIKEPGKSFFILDKGSLEVIVKNKVNLTIKEKRKINIMEGFGETALLSKTPRSSTVKALEDSYLW